MTKRNENRLGYKKTRVRWMPEEWIVKTFSHISNVVRGSSPRPAGSPLFFDGTYIPWITVAELTNNEGMFLKSTKSMLTEEGAKRSRIFPEGTLLLVNSGATLGVPKITCIDACGNDGIAGFLDLSSEADISFLYYFLCTKTRYFRDCLAPGLGQPNLNTELIGGVSIPLPPLPEQKKIAEILSAWDRTIEQVGKLIDAKQRLKKGLMQQLLIGKKRLPGFREKWMEVYLREFIEEKRERNKRNSIERVLSVTNDRGFILPEDQFGRRVASSDLSNYKTVRKGQFAYNPSRINVGSWDLLETFEEGVISPMYVVFGTKKGLDSHYLALWMSSDEGSQRIRLSAQGSVRHTVSFDSLGSIKLKLPKIDEQIAITSVLMTARREVKLLQDKVIALRMQKKGLMQQLLTGKIRINQ